MQASRERRGRLLHEEPGVSVRLIVLDAEAFKTNGGSDEAAVFSSAAFMFRPIAGRLSLYPA
jgi:hypothetical protein